MASEVNDPGTLLLLANRAKETSDDPNDILTELKFTSSYLANLNPLDTATGDEESITGISSWISKVIVPGGETISYDSPLDEPPSQSQLSALAVAKEAAKYGLTTLTQLFNLLPTPRKISPSILTSVTAHTSSLDEWTTEETNSLATEFLSKFSNQPSSINFIVNDILQSFIRPLFAKSKKLDSITSTGRKAMETSGPRARFDASEPWRYEVVYAVSVYEWAIKSISPANIQPNLHLILPPLLHLLDTTSTRLRHRGLRILPLLLHKMTPQTLTQTGLGSVFEDAVTPTLMFLPSLTPIPESELLIPAAWAAIFTISDVWYTNSPQSSQTSTTVPTSKSPKPIPETSALSKISSQLATTSFSTTDVKILPSRTTSDNKQNKETTTRDLEKRKTQYLLNHLRTSLLPAFTYTQPVYPTLTTILLDQLSLLIRRLGVYTIKHLKDIIPLCSSILIDPFIKLSTLTAALDVLKQVILTCWARIVDDGEDGGGERWRMEILRIVVTCWVTLRDVDGQTHQSVREEGDDGVLVKDLAMSREELNAVGRLLVAAVQQAGDEKVVQDFMEHVRRLVEAGTGLKEVFGISDI